jgi:hypothetical protein
MRRPRGFSKSKMLMDIARRRARERESRTDDDGPSLRLVLIITGLAILSFFLVQRAPDGNAPPSASNQPADSVRNAHPR